MASWLDRITGAYNALRAVPEAHGVNSDDTNAAGKKGAAITSLEERWGGDAYGQPPDIKMSTLVAYRRTDYMFSMITRTNTAFSVGAGYYNTVDDEGTAGKTALEIVDAYCEEWDLDTVNQLTGIDAWSAGNGFIDGLAGMSGGASGTMLAGLQQIPLSSIVGIIRDAYGRVEKYRQLWGGLDNAIPAEYVMHMSWLPDDASAWGTGLGQIMARPGRGYRTNSGKIVQRPPLFQSREMMSDIAVKHTYGALPRYSVKMPHANDTAVAKMNNLFKKLDPLQHLVHNMDAETEPLALPTQGKYDTFYRHVDDDSVMAMMSPLTRLWTSMSFTYASAKEAVDAMMPLIRYYQRKHKRFVERQIYRPILRQELGWDDAQIRDAGVHINWGRQEPLELEAIGKIFRILSDDKLDGLWDPHDIIDLLREAGAKLNAPEDAAGNTGADDLEEQARDLQKMRDEARDVKAVHPSSMTDMERAKLELSAKKVAILERLTARAGAA